MEEKRRLSDLEKLLELDYRLSTAEILYHLPDHPVLLQTYIWQDFDLSPDFPVLNKFLLFWERSLDGRLHSVKVASCELIRPSDFRFTAGRYLIH